MMSLATKLTCYLLLGVLAVMGLDLYLSVKRIQTDLLHDVRREVAAISGTLRLALTLIDRTDSPGQYFNPLRGCLPYFGGRERSKTAPRTRPAPVRATGDLRE